MKKRNRTLVALCAGILFFGLAASQGLAASTNNGNGNGNSANPSKPSLPNDGLHRDGTAFAREGKVTQLDRQAAADRAKAKGFVIGQAISQAAPGKNTQGNGGAPK